MSLYDDASLIMFPSGYKEDKIYSLKPTDGSGDLTFTRASSATRVNADGLIEGVRTNLALYSEQFDNAAWTKANGAAVTANTATSPDGTQNADLIYGATSGSITSIQQSSSISSSSTTYTNSIFVKYSGKRWFFIFELLGNSGANFFDIQNGVLGTQNYGSGAFITNMGDGWYRVGFSQTIASSVVYAIYGISNADNTFANTASGTNGAYIYGAQLEVSDFGATEYIPTTSAAVSVGMLADVPRIDYTGGGCGKLLLESQRTNNVTYSEDFSNAAWTKNFVTLTANAAIAPDGTISADNFAPTTDSVGNHRIFDIAASSIQSATYSIFIKPNGHNYYAFRESATSGASIGFNLAAQSVTVTYSTGGCTASNGKIEAYANGWYRLSGTFSFASATFQSFGFYAAASTWTSGDVESVTWAGNGTSGAFIWGAQLEAGSYVSSYIPTLASSVTRLADAASKTGISSLIGATEGTIFVEAKVTINGRLMLIGTGGNFIEVLTNSAGKVNAFVRTSVTEADILSAATYATGDTLKIAFAYKVNDFALYVNGTAQGTDTSGNVPTGMAQLIVNDYTASGYNSANAYSQALLFPTRLTNTQLATLTTL